MLKAKRLGVYSLIGIILLTVGLSFTIYNKALVNEARELYTLSIENGYTANFTINLNYNDRVLIYISPFKQVNYTLTIKTSNATTVINSTQIYNKTLLITVNSSETHRFSLNELPPFQYTQIRFEMVRYANEPVNTYIVFGLPLTIIGVLLSILGFRELGFLKIKIGGRPSYSLKEFSLIIAGVMSYSLIIIMLQRFPIGLIFQDWLIIGLLLFVSLMNIILIYLISMILTGDKLKLFSILLVALAYLWIPLSLTFLIQSQAIVFNYYDPDNSLSFELIKDFAVNYTSIYFQIILLVLIFPLFYIYLGYNWGKSISIDTGSSQENQLPTTPLTLLKNQLIDSVHKKDAASFFKILREESIEASAILYIVIREYVDKGVCEFTYHKLITEYSDLFNKKLYERKPVEHFLAPLSLVEQPSGRFKFFKLNTDAQEIKFIVKSFNQHKNLEFAKFLEDASGVGELRERKLKFSGSDRF
ncbi:MAG: hypothetical protein QW327_00300 [Candidatus Odinarchaeota archaeon]